MSSTRSHWEDVYRRKSTTDVSWYQPHLARSLSWIETLAKPTDAVIDIGGGASTLVDDLLLRDFRDITVLDISAAALKAAQTRAGDRTARASWIEADVTNWSPARCYRVWHDRAAFHFMTTPAQQDRYVTALRAGTEAGSVVIIGTFALDGPDKCSGLPVQRYSAETLACRLGPDFQLSDRAEEVHKTPWATEQRFSFVAFRRVCGARSTRPGPA